MEACDVVVFAIAMLLMVALLLVARKWDADDFDSVFGKGGWR